MCARCEVILGGRFVAFFTCSRVLVSLSYQHREPFIIFDNCWVFAS